jgi:hypothetical protein
VTRFRTVVSSRGIKSLAGACCHGHPLQPAEPPIVGRAGGLSKGAAGCGGCRRIALASQPEISL